MISKPSVPLPHNARFYILCTAILTSLVLAAALRLHIDNDQLYYIRLEQAYGLLSVVCLYLAMLVSPLQKALNGQPWMRYAVFARRAIGVAAAYFAVLHLLVALWGQIGGPSGLSLLPLFFVWAVVLGVIALMILLLMAATSFDAVIKHMTFPRWKLLHRLVYAAGILIILHIWMISTHIAYAWAQLAAGLAIALLLGLEALRESSVSAFPVSANTQASWPLACGLRAWQYWPSYP